MGTLQGRVRQSLQVAGQACHVVADGPERSRGCQGAAMRRPGIRGVAEAYCYAGANPISVNPPFPLSEKEEAAARGIQPSEGELCARPLSFPRPNCVQTCYACALLQQKQ